MENEDTTFEPELDEDLFDDEFEDEEDIETVKVEDYDAHALDEEDEDWEDS